MKPRVVVVGAGITGLAAAWYLRDHADVVLLEASTRPGGKIRSEEVAGTTVETGADAVLAREPDGVALLEDVGLADELVAPATGEVRVWVGGRLHPLPDGLVLGAPTRVRPLLRSSLLSTRGALRAALDLVLPGEVDVDDGAVAELVRHRYGEEVLERLVAPLVAGINAGDPERLEAASATPALAEAARRGPSLMRSLRERPVAPGPVFLAPRGGLSRLVDVLAGASEVRTAAPVRLVERDGSGFRVHVGGGDDVGADAVVVATPAGVAAAAVRELAPEASQLLREVPYASVATVTLVLPDRVNLAGSGLLVPTSERRLVKAATWMSAKWPDRYPRDRVVVRASVGRFGDTAALELDDEELVGRVHAELDEAVGLPAPVGALVSRWERALPQYVLGHAERVAGVRAAVAAVDGLEVAGAALDGIGVAACVRQARTAAERLLGRLGAVSRSRG